MTGLLGLLVSLYFVACVYLRIPGVLSQGLMLPADWLNRAARTELEGMAALAVVCGLIIYGYVGKFDEVAGKAETDTE